MSHNYFEAIANYPRYYRELNVRVADLDLEAKNLESSLHDSDSLRIATIVSSIHEYESAMKIRTVYWCIPKWLIDISRITIS